MADESGRYGALLREFETAMVVKNAEIGQLCRQRDELRAILAPLLDVPLSYRERPAYNELPCCLFCSAEANGTGDVFDDSKWTDTTPHKPDCPVLRRDALLGRG